MAAQLERKFDRVVHFDEKSRNFPIRTVIAHQKPRSYTWRCETNLDQGSEGACVGFGWSHFLAARPKAEPRITDSFAFAVYNEAKTLDEWAGEDYEGTSVLAGAKTITGRKYIKEYRWAFGVEDALLAVAYAGPVVLGVNWYEGMDNYDSNGLVKVTGSVRGGHCIMLNGINVKKGLVRLHNSWGKGWGVNGDCFMTFDDLSKLLQDDGEACIPVSKILLK